MPSIRAVTPVDIYIGEKIRSHRNQLKISQDALGDMLGVSFQQVQKYEKGLNRVSGARLQQIAQIFKLHVADLLPEQRGGKKAALSNLDRVAATRDGMKLINSFVAIKNETLRAAVVDLARRLQAV